MFDDGQPISDASTPVPANEPDPGPAEVLSLDADLRVRLFDEAPDSIFVCDFVGRILAVNQMACDSLRYPQDDLLKRTLLDIDPTMESNRLAELWRELATGEAICVDGQHRRQDG